MARLNDPPAPAAESIDALKRRFIRQNRELARVNSNQSQRIRNLETEISRLLAENIALRERAIRSATEAEQWRTSSGLSRDVLALKETLAMKVEEVQALVNELGMLPAKAATRPSERRRKSRFGQRTTTSPDEQDWKDRQPLGAERETQEGRLPAILEDKCYPRRTLENGELQSIMDDAIRQQQDTESPDLGPPPVAHFEASEPISFDSRKSPKRVSGGIVPDEEEVLVLPNNLETRRKRRTSSLLQDMPAVSNEQSNATDGQFPISLRPGAKRKLEASQLDEVIDRPLQADTFVFQRKPAITLNPKASRFTSAPARRHQDVRVSITEAESKPPQKTSEATRQVLGPKSTNSPAKRSVTSNTEKDINANDKDHKLPKINSQNRMRNKPLRVDLPLEPETEPRSVLLQPKTPGLELTDLLSPSSIPTQPSTKPVASEIAVINSVEDVLNGSIGRGSRRARAAVSYAEPNLRDKMRRPDKKLVGAVEGLHRRETSVDIENDRGGRSITNGQDIEIKCEEPATGADNKWKSLPVTIPNMSPKLEPTSPLRGKEKKTNPMRGIDRSHKRTYSEAEGTCSSENGKSDEQLDRAIQNLSIFDPPASSPISEGNIEKPVSTRSETDPIDGASHKHNFQRSDTAIPTRTRRHSVQMQSNSAEDMKSNPGIISGFSRQRSAASERDLGSIYRDSSSSGKLKRANSVQALVSAQPPNTSRTHQRTSSTHTGQKSGIEEPNTRTASTRRSSMMV